MALRFVAQSCRALLQRGDRPLSWTRTLAHYPVNDAMFGLDEDRQKLREVAFNFFQKELAPLAKEIDKFDNFK